jgi:hypothetical protein
VTKNVKIDECFCFVGEFYGEKLHFGFYEFQIRFSGGGKGCGRKLGEE